MVGVGKSGSAPPTRTPDISSYLRKMRLFLVQIEPKVLELPAPLGLRIAQALDVDAAREAAFDAALTSWGARNASESVRLI